MLAHHFHFFQRQRIRLVEDFDGNERLADIVQQGSADKTALVVVAHAEMLRERDRKAVTNRQCR